VEDIKGTNCQLLTIAVEGNTISIQTANCEYMTCAQTNDKWLQKYIRIWSYMYILYIYEFVEICRDWINDQISPLWIIALNYRNLDRFSANPRSPLHVSARLSKFIGTWGVTRFLAVMSYIAIGKWPFSAMICLWRVKIFQSCVKVPGLPRGIYVSGGYFLKPDGKWQW
jgi:hypothetical protein